MNIPLNISVIRETKMFLSSKIFLAGLFEIFSFALCTLNNDSSFCRHHYFISTNESSVGELPIINVKSFLNSLFTLKVLTENR